MIVTRKPTSKISIPEHIDPQSIAWAAGLLEGEGSFELHEDHYPKVRLEMTDGDIVHRFAELFGGYPVHWSRRKAMLPHHLTPYRVIIGGANAAKVMRIVRPHMGIRRSKAIASILDIYEARSVG